MTTELDDRLGRRLRLLRKSLGLTQRDLGDAVGVSHKQIHRYESGRSRMPAARLWQCALTLGATIDSFFEGFGPHDGAKPASHWIGLASSAGSRNTRAADLGSIDGPSGTDEQRPRATRSYRRPRRFAAGGRHPVRVAPACAAEQDIEPP